MEFLKAKRVSNDVYNTLLNFATGYILEKPRTDVEYGLRFFRESITFANSKSAVEGEKSLAVEYDDLASDVIEIVKRRRGICLKIESTLENEVQSVCEIEKTSKLRLKLFFVKTFPFKYLDEACVEEIIDKMFSINVTADSIVIREGDVGQNVFVVRSGMYEERIKSLDGNTLMFQYNSWGCFGKSSLIFPHFSPTTIVSKTEGVLWVLNCDDYRKTVVAYQKKMRNLKRQCVDSWPVISKLTTEDKDKLIDSIVLLRFKRGNSIINGTQETTGFYYVKSGEISIVKPKSRNGEVATEIAILGDHFGDVSMFCGRLNGTRAMALRSSEIFFLSASAFNRLLGPLADKAMRNEEINNSLMKQISDLLERYEKSPALDFLKFGLHHYDTMLNNKMEGEMCNYPQSKGQLNPSKIDNVIMLPPRKGSEENINQEMTNSLINFKTSTDNLKTVITLSESSLDNTTYTVLKVNPKNEQIDKIRSVMKTLAIFSILQEREINEIIKDMQLVKVYPGNYVVKRGNLGKFFYIIEKGSFKFLIQGDGVTHEILNCPKHFGEMGLIFDVPRFADVLATSEGRLWALSRDQFRKITNTYLVQKKGLNFKRLKTTESLKYLRDYDVKALSRAMENLTYSDREIILAFEQDSCGLYFIKQGTVRVFSRRYQNNVKLLKKGQCFGFLVFSTEKCKKIKAQAIGSSKIARLTIDSFEKLLGHCRQVLHQNDYFPH